MFCTFCNVSQLFYSSFCAGVQICLSTLGFYRGSEVLSFGNVLHWFKYAFFLSFSIGVLLSGLFVLAWRFNDVQWGSNMLVYCRVL